MFQKIHTLSGGERGRLALAILALTDANFLLLDEPTNHLDIPAQETLQEALETFDGTILLVTHDRYLVNRLATQIWALREGRLSVHKGGYQSYLEARRQQASESEKEVQVVVEETPAGSSPNQGLSKNEQRRREAALQRLLDEIAALEQAVEDLAHQLQAVSVAQDFDKIQSTSIEYEAAQHRLENKVAEWEKMASE